MAVERDWDNATLKVHQAKYIDDMVHKFNLADAYAVSTPAEVGADVPGSNKPLAAEMPYQALVSSMLYAMVATRPDIAEAVSKLCRVMAKPEERHWQAAKRVLRYLKGNKTLGLTFSGGKADGLMHGKHIAIKYHFTREKVLSGEVAIEYCPTAQMVADALTKALGRLKHAEFAMQMLGA
eukprot:jgi/Tetstr1/462678/TSEL_007644.t1